jgi:YidC/Oxa1 family membrane protein insertase
MDKNTLIAVVLSVVVITGGFIVQNIFFPPEYSTIANGGKAQEAPVTQAVPGQTNQIPAPVTSGSVASPSVAQPAAPAVNGTVIPTPDTAVSVEKVVIETDLFSASFTTKGAILTSLLLKQHRDGNSFVDLVKHSSPDAGAFGFAFGGPDAKTVDTLFHVRRPNAGVVEFYRDFQIAGFENSAFRLTKRFIFKPGEYMFQSDVVLENSVNQYLPLNFNGLSYTLEFGPQIGPGFTKLDPQYDYRKFITLSDGKREEIAHSKQEIKAYEKKTSWVGIIGKYFTVIAVPVFSEYKVNLSTLPVAGDNETATILISKPVIKSAQNTDSYRFYAGPKTSTFLERYNDSGKNAFGVQGVNLDQAIDSNVFLGWLEWILKELLRIFFFIVPNWGIAIILVTFLVKIVTWPLTHKSIQSTSRMQQLAPKLEELKKKHSGNPQKLNQETAELYKKEGINPLSGCLPMLLQIPIFFAMYGLFSNHFDLRGAAFIPGWISDLSAPESIFRLPYELPLVGWSDIRLLPILFVFTQILSSKVTQTPSSGSNAQMKMFIYLMPIVFFFILYNVPSGLLVYWIVMNVLSAAQQLYINNSMKKKKA